MYNYKCCNCGENVDNNFYYIGNDEVVEKYLPYFENQNFNIQNDIYYDKNFLQNTRKSKDTTTNLFQNQPDFLLSHEKQKTLDNALKNLVIPKKILKRIKKEKTKKQVKKIKSEYNPKNFSNIIIMLFLLFIVIMLR